MLKELPEATIVPLAIDGTWKIERYSLRGIPVGVRITLHALTPIEAASLPRRELADHIDTVIRTELDRIQAAER